MGYYAYRIDDNVSVSRRYLPTERGVERGGGRGAWQMSLIFRFIPKYTSKQYIACRLPRDGWLREFTDERRHKRFGE